MSKIQNERLLVFAGSQLLGYLWMEHGQKMAFQYSQEYLDSSDAFGISLSLPLRREAFLDERPERFFENLLPEGRARSQVAERLGLSEDNAFALLRAIGGECAGALSILLEGATQELHEEQSYQVLSEEEIMELASTGQSLSVVAGKRKMRLSLAGAQDKLPVLYQGGKFLLPLGTSPSSHILKFQNRDFSHLPANEVLTNWIAKSVGLSVVDVDLHVFGENFACLVKRYDRQEDEDHRLHRIHQEDFCQALGLAHSTKYEGEGGPSFADCFKLLNRESSEPLLDSQQLLRWLAFNAVVGNADGHAKNISLLYLHGRSIRLAPFYDLVSTRAYRNLDRNLAIGVSGVSDPGQIRGTDWSRLAEEIGVGKKFIHNLVRGLAESIRAYAPQVAKKFRDFYGDSPVIQMIIPTIEKQARRIITQLDV